MVSEKLHGLPLELRKLETLHGLHIWGIVSFGILLPWSSVDHEEHDEGSQVVKDYNVQHLEEEVV